MERKELEHRLRVLLPATYEIFDEEVRPVSMGSAGLRFAEDGKVAWDRIWGSFCDLAMAGGPPHRGTLLAPGPEGNGYDGVVAELCRGLELVTGLCAERAATPGWVRLYCPAAAMAGWLVRAVTMENVSCRHEGLALELPAGAHFRVEKEIKNVITAVAKTCHYWRDHMATEQQQEVAALLRAMDRAAPLLQPRWARAPSPDAEPNAEPNAGPDMQVERLVDRIADAVRGRTGKQREASAAAGWVGFRCADVAEAIGLMRTLVCCNVLAHREGTAVFVPADTASDPDGSRVVEAMAEARRLLAQPGLPRLGSSGGG